MSFGYTGSILRVDLSTGKISCENPGEIFYRTYMGGRGIGTYYLLKEAPADCDPLGHENVLTFSISVVTGAPVPGVSRFSAVTKSPLTNGFAESEAGGNWGPELKFAGFDAIVVKGRAEKPVYLWIHDGKAELRDAKDLWGKETGIVQEILREQLNDSRVRVLQIGPAGENLVRFACVITDLNHALGRCGIGAVMGAKNLKAIAVRGSNRVAMVDPERIRAKTRWFGENFCKNGVHQMLRELGTCGAVAGTNVSGLLPTHNFTCGQFEHARQLDGETMKAMGLLKGKDGCYACPVRCKPVMEMEGPITIDASYGGPEYETIGALGSACEIGDPRIVAKAHELCNRYGLDTISTGITIAFAMEAKEKGLLKDSEAPCFGDGKAVLSLIEKIALRKGLGDVLAEGSKRFAEAIGAEKLAMHVKGQECPLHEPRGKVGVGLGYAVSPTGADHLQAEHDSCFTGESIFLEQVKCLGLLEPVSELDLGPAKVRMFVKLQKLWSMYNVLDLCTHVGVPGRTFTLADWVDIVNGVTGWETSAEELLEAGERSLTMTRIFNLAAGKRVSDDTLPPRFFEGLANGPYKGQKIEPKKLSEAISLYYKMMGWDDEGIPTFARLALLNISWAGEKLPKRSDDGNCRL